LIADGAMGIRWVCSSNAVAVKITAPGINSDLRVVRFQISTSWKPLFLCEKKSLSPLARLIGE
jgi:hypothetical protein